MAILVFVGANNSDSGSQGANLVAAKSEREREASATVTHHAQQVTVATEELTRLPARLLGFRSQPFGLAKRQNSASSDTFADALRCQGK